MKLVPKPGTSVATNDGPASRIFQRDRHAVGIEAGDEPRHAERPVKVVPHVLFARPHELDRLAELLGDEHRLADIFLDGAAPAEAAAEHRAVHHDLVIRDAGGDGGGGERGGGALGRHPDLDSVGSDVRGAGLRLHGRVREERDRVVGLDPPHGARKTGGYVAVGAADLTLFHVQAAAHELGDLGARHAVVAAVVPDDRQRLQRALGAPPGIGHHRDRFGHPHYAAHALHGGDGVLIDRPQLAAIDRALHDRGVEHVGQPHVDRIDRLRHDLGEHVEPPARLADELPFARVFQLDLRGRLDPGGGFGDGAE